MKLRMLKRPEFVFIIAIIASFVASSYISYRFYCACLSVFDVALCSSAVVGAAVSVLWIVRKQTKEMIEEIRRPSKRTSY